MVKDEVPRPVAAPAGVVGVPPPPVVAVAVAAGVAAAADGQGGRGAAGGVARRVQVRSGCSEEWWGVGCVTYIV